MEKVEKQLKMPQGLVEDAEEYQGLLDLRDVAETEIRKTNDRNSANKNLKDIFDKLRARVTTKEGSTMPKDNSSDSRQI